MSTPGLRLLTSRRRRIGALVLGLALAAAAVLAGIRLMMPEKWGCVVGAVSFDHVDVPPDNASPADVVRAYLRALDRHDTDTAAKLYPPPNGSGSLACNVRAIDNVRITSAATSGDASAGGGTVRVDAQFTVHVFAEARAGQVNGPTGRNYYLRQVNGDTGAWRIVSSGQG